MLFDIREARAGRYLGAQLVRRHRGVDAGREQHDTCICDTRARLSLTMRTLRFSAAASGRRTQARRFNRSYARPSCPGLFTRCPERSGGAARRRSVLPADAAHNPRHRKREYSWDTCCLRAAVRRRPRANCDKCRCRRRARVCSTSQAMFLGAAEEGSGRFDQARAAYESAAAPFPAAQSPLLALSALATRRGDRTSALKHIQRLFDLPASRPTAERSVVAVPSIAGTKRGCAVRGCMNRSCRRAESDDGATGFSPRAAAVALLTARRAFTGRDVFEPRRSRSRGRPRDRQRTAGARAVPADFEIRDNGIAQQIDLISFEQVPLNVILAFDMSDSVAGDVWSGCARRARDSGGAGERRSVGARDVQPDGQPAVAADQ